MRKYYVYGNGVVIITWLVYLLIRGWLLHSNTASSVEWTHFRIEIIFIIMSALITCFRISFFVDQENIKSYVVGILFLIGLLAIMISLFFLGASFVQWKFDGGELIRSVYIYFLILLIMLPIGMCLMSRR